MGYVRYTTETFIEEARKIHRDKYDYSQVKYVNSRTKVKIICPKHGIFEQTPHGHLTGRGCYKCGNKKQQQSRCLTTEQFIEKARKIHGNKYDYSLVEYKKNSIKVKIICPKHGVFEQTPVTHLRGSGCRRCTKKKAHTDD